MASLPNPGTIRSSFDSYAEAEAATILAPINRIFVGDLCYARDATGTALTTNGGAVKWSPSGQITFQHFADNATPGNTAFNEPISRMLTWLRANQNNDNLAPGPLRTVSGMGEKIALTGPIYTAGLKHVEFIDTEFVAIGNDWPVWDGTTDFFGNRNHAAGMWNLSNGPTEMSARQTSDVSFRNCVFNANDRAAGFVRANSTRSQCGVIDCQGYRPTDYGVFLVSGQNNDFRISGNRFRQYEYADPERLDANNLTAVLLDLRSPDAKVTGNTIYYCNLPVYIGAYVDFYENHLFQGVDDALGAPIANLPADLLPVLVVESPGGLVCDNYLDTGHVIFNVRANAVATGHQVMFERNKFFFIAGAHSFAVKIVTDQADTTLAGFSFKDNTIRRDKAASLVTEAVIAVTGGGSYVAPDLMRHISKDNHRADTFRHIWRGLPDWEPIPFWTTNQASDTVEGLYAIKMLPNVGTTVTNATGGKLGQSLTVVCVNSLTTFAHNAGSIGGRFILSGGTNLTPSAGQVIQFVYDGTNWRQVAISA